MVMLREFFIFIFIFSNIQIAKEEEKKIFIVYCSVPLSHFFYEVVKYRKI